MVFKQEPVFFMSRWKRLTLTIGDPPVSIGGAVIDQTANLASKFGIAVAGMLAGLRQV